MNYIDFLNNDIVVDIYNKIDKVNPYPFNHGLKHAKNVCNVMDKLCNLLGITGEKKESLLIASALHDIGQVDGREQHGKKAKNFLIKNFEKELIKQEYYTDILTAIEMHDSNFDVDNSLFTILVQFCDKMDFSKERLEDNYREKFRYYCWEDVICVDFIIDDNRFGINIITENVDNFDELFSKENFSRKIVNAVEVLAKKLNKKPVILNNGKNMNISISNYIIVHGSFGSKDGNWFPWLKNEIERENYKVDVPQMPIGVENQNYENWSKEFSKLVINNNTVIIAHSIAPAFVCKYLINNHVKVKKLIFVCGFNNYLGINSEYDTVNKPMFLDNIEEIKSYCNDIICFYSNNDPYVNFDVEKEFADLIANEQIIINNGGHINAESGFTKFDEIIKYL